MKPFNLEAAIRGEKVITRDGREFIFGAYNKYAIVGRSVIGWVNGKVVSSSPNTIVDYLMTVLQGLVTMLNESQHIQQQTCARLNGFQIGKSLR